MKGENNPRYGKPAWNHGLTKETDDRIKSNIEKWKEGYRSGKFKLGGKRKDGKIHRPMLGKVPWNKGLTSDVDERIKKASESIKEKYKQGILKQTVRSKDEMAKIGQKISETAKKNKKSGGKRHGAGRGKNGWYKGYWCDSSWELAYVIYNLEHDIKFERNYEGFEYEFEGKKHKFYPDFKLEDGSYVEVKGWLTAQTISKISQFKKCIFVVDKYEITKYLKYVEDKYGKDYIRFYDDKILKVEKILRECGECKNILSKNNKIGLCKVCSAKRMIKRIKKEKQPKRVA